MSSKVEQIASWLGGARLETKNTTSTTTIVGTAVSDSNAGEVEVVIGDDTMGYGDSGTGVVIPTTEKVKEGDSVIINLTGNDNAKSPTVMGVVGRGDEMASGIEQAEKVSSEAQAAVAATNQHFFHDDNGVHIATQPDDGGTGPNLLANSQGVLLRDGEKIMSAHTPSGFTVYNGKGNDAGNVVATFGATVKIGNDNYRAQLLLDNDSLDIGDGVHIGYKLVDGNILPPLYDKDGNPIGGGVGWIAYYPFFSFGGMNDTVIGVNSVEMANGRAEANLSVAACGGTTSGNAPYSFAAGDGTITEAARAIALGKFNETKDALFVVGNGTSPDSRSDALIVRENGNAEVSGDATISGATTINGLATFKNGADVVGDITCSGSVLDEVKSGKATIGSGIATNSSCQWAKTGHIVQVVCWIKVNNALATYSTINGVFSGLPKAKINGDVGPLKIDNSTGSCFARVSPTGTMNILTRETALTAGGVVVGSFFYISSE